MRRVIVLNDGNQVKTPGHLLLPAGEVSGSQFSWDSATFLCANIFVVEFGVAESDGISIPPDEFPQNSRDLVLAESLRAGTRSDRPSRKCAPHRKAEKLHSAGVRL